jgi:type VI secretion system protein ImpA
MLALDELIQPTSVSPPSGENLRYDRVYDDIRKARRSDPPDYKLIVKLASEALAKRSKDLWIAVWLTDALIRQQAFAGLRCGIDLISKLIENFWDGLFPEAEEGNLEMRGAPLDWLGNYLELAKDSSPILSVRSIAVTANGFDFLQYQESQSKRQGAIAHKDFDAAIDATPKAYYKTHAAEIVACIESIEKLRDLCKEKFGPAAPGFFKLRAEMEQIQAANLSLLQKKLIKEPDPPEPVTQPKIDPEKKANEEGPGPLKNPEIKNTSYIGEVSGLEPSSPKEAVARIAAVALYLRKLEPSNPVPYLLLRSLRWAELRATAELSASLLNAPTTELRTQIKRLAAAGQWGELLEQTETAMAGECGRAWLDLQRYAVMACEKLGHAAVATAIKSELRCLLKDLPALVKATLDDDTGTANPETLSWLNDQVQINK